MSAESGGGCQLAPYLPAPFVIALVMSGLLLGNSTSVAPIVTTVGSAAFRKLAFGRLALTIAALGAVVWCDGESG